MGLISISVLLDSPHGLISVQLEMQQMFPMIVMLLPIKERRVHQEVKMKRRRRKRT
jgi:hypothetical protein